MAATKRNAMLIAEARQKIKTTQLINRLQNHGLGTLKPPLDQTQIRAIEVLLRKSVPDLQSVAHTGADGEGPMQVSVNGFPEIESAVKQVAVNGHANGHDTE